jgi:urea transport system permease protein
MPALRPLRDACRAVVLTGLMALWGTHALALTQEDALQLVEGDTTERIETLQRLVEEPTPQAVELIRALAESRVKVLDSRVVIEHNEVTVDAVTGEGVEAEYGSSPMLNNRMRSALNSALATLDLLSQDTKIQQAAALRLRNDAFQNPSVLPMELVQQVILKPDTDPVAANYLRQAWAMSQMSSEDAQTRIEAAQTLGAVGMTIVRSRVAQQLEQETDAQVQTALSRALSKIDSALTRGQVIGQLFTGVSLGSVLLLAALGLAITYGLLGVINMAHGELIMIGAYATFVVQGLFKQFAPAWFEWYVVAAIPVAFMTAALVGAMMERGVIRWLYGRPLETLLATWGLSLILMQVVRSVFGAQNVAVENPDWLSGGWMVMGNLTLPWNRIVIIGFALLVLLMVALLINRTRLGLFVRGVTQNRPIAACMGVNTARIDTYAFALGSGVAGLAGVALSQLGNVGPDLGQSYIVDSFMVVVLGGVGQLAGTVYAALGLGLLNKFIEGWAGAVLAKIAVLVFIIIFIQKRPQGIFALKGRQA